MMKLFDLSGETAVITGASKGLGESFSHALAQAGADLFLIARTGEGLARVSQDIREHYGVCCAWCTADITNPSDIQAAVAKCMESYGKIDILVNNAAAMRNNKPPQDTTPEEFNAVMYPNVIGTWMMCQEAGAVMRRQQKGRIVNISSISSKIVNRGVHGGSYEVSKAAVSMLTKTLAVEWAPFGIQVNAICPGYFGTQPNRDFFAADPDFEQIVLDMIPMRRLGTPEDLWGALLLLCSPASSYMQGEIITVDGGYTLW